MKTIAALIELALEDLKLDVARIENQNPSTDPYIVYNQVTKSPNIFFDNKEYSRTFIIDVDIYTKDASLIDEVSEAVEKRLKSVGFKLKPSAGTIVERDVEPIVYHEPLEFEYEKELI
nr:hypothetical protein [uncultured Cellulosilyticum sp.]